MRCFFLHLLLYESTILWRRMHLLIYDRLAVLGRVCGTADWSLSGKGAAERGRGKSRGERKGSKRREDERKAVH